MERTLARLLAKAVLLSAAFASLTACAPTTGNTVQHMEVASAFETSNVIAVKPYTRTIFSTNDF
jgi:type IV pilus biogenesis protein CpaD/CtpE